MTKPTVSKHWRKPVGRRDQAWIPPEPLQHVTIIQLEATASTHSVRVPVWQTQSVWPVRTAHISVLRTANICHTIQHRAVLTIFLFTRMLSSGGEGDEGSKHEFWIGYWHIRTHKHINYICYIHCGPKNCHHCSFYKCWPISIIFGTHYTELICNIICPPRLRTACALPCKRSRLQKL